MQVTQSIITSEKMTFISMPTIMDYNVIFTHSFKHQKKPLSKSQTTTSVRSFKTEEDPLLTMFVNSKHALYVITKKMTNADSHLRTTFNKIQFAVGLKSWKHSLKMNLSKLLLDSSQSIT